VERHASVTPSITILEFLICVFVVYVQGVSTHTHHCSSANHAGHRLIIVVVGAGHWIIVSTSWFQTVEMVAKTGDSLAREDTEDVPLVLGEFYEKVSS
jgi:hypothetical protein